MYKLNKYCFRQTLKRSFDTIVLAEHFSQLYLIHELINKSP